ncbi:MAG: pyrroline-5-carboxylate reductase [Nitrospirota bacterium]
MSIDKKITFLGGGNMAEALIKGLIAAGTAKPDQILVADILSDRLEHLRKTYGIIIHKSSKDAVSQAEIVLLCVKPQAIDMVLTKIGPVADKGKLVISIAAGVTIARLEKILTGGPRVVRVMPNTPALVLAGATALAGGKNATSDDLALAQSIFNSVGRSFVVDEKLMDAVTGLSGSGPAYVFTIIEALADAGVKAGLPRQLALELAAQTVYGAAKMVLETKEHPGKLRDMVTSPGGTTIEGLHALEEGKLRATLMNAVAAATERSRELGK